MRRGQRHLAHARGAERAVGPRRLHVDDLHVVGDLLDVGETGAGQGRVLLDVLKVFGERQADALGQGGGIAVNFKNFTDKLLAYDGTLNTKSDSLESELKSNTAEQDKVNKRADALEKRLYAQYSALDTKMASLNALNAYVSQMVTTWNNSKS